MSDFIVLVKQVPDVTRIGDDAFDKKTGNLKRSELPAVVNELDCQALGFAEYMRRLQGGTGKIIALTMGPDSAKEVLKYALARCADEAVLLSDPVIAGSDTWATAKALSFGIRKVVAELLGGTDDYYVISGMQSVDGDTAQVPAQISRDLDIPIVAYTTNAEYEQGEFAFQNIIKHGSEKLKPLSKPAFVTIAKFDRLFPSFTRTRLAKTKDIVCFDAFGIDETSVGVKGSKTRVVKVFRPDKCKRGCKQLGSPKELAELITSLAGSVSGNDVNEDCDEDYILPANRGVFFDRSFEANEKDKEAFEWLSDAFEELAISTPEDIDGSVLADLKERITPAISESKLDKMLEALKLKAPSYSGDVWVIAETDNGEIESSTLELIGEARRIANQLDVKVGVVLVGKDVSSHSEEFIAYGADVVYLVENDLLEQYEAGLYCNAVGQIVEKYKPQIVFFGATPRGRVLAPLVAYKSDCGLTADCTSFAIRDNSLQGQIAILYQTRPALGGNVMATIITKNSFCQMATARPGIFQKPELNPDRRGEIIGVDVEIDLSQKQCEVLEIQRESADVSLGADIVISGGKGMLNKANYETLLSKLCEAIESSTGIKAGIGASRAAVEQGFTIRSHQVGQTGTAISPKIYIAIGISGAIQHMTGVANAKTVIAINSDPEAKINSECDYFLTARAEEAIPQLIKELTDSCVNV